MKEIKVINKLIEKKIPNADLRYFVSSNKQETRPVLIELKVPTLKVKMTKTHGLTTGKFKPVGVKELSASELTKKKRIEESVKKKLHKIIGNNPVWLKAGNAFLARIGPEELRQVVRLNEVKNIKLRQE